jgi:hypothetical protein
MSNIDQHVTSLELSKRLNELGVKRDESCFIWKNYFTKPDKFSVAPRVVIPLCNLKEDEWCPAYLASELGEMLPCLIKDKSKDAELFLHLHAQDDRLHIAYVSYSHMAFCPNASGFTSHNMADMYAKMLIYLIENSHVKPEDLC